MHLKPDIDGNLPPSALIPFCSYQEDVSLLGQKRIEMRNLILCDKFQPIILDGQMCYSLNVENYSKKRSKAGKKGGLFLLLDPSPYQMSQSARNLDEEYNEQNSFKV